MLLPVDYRLLLENIFLREMFFSPKIQLHLPRSNDYAYPVWYLCIKLIGTRKKRQTFFKYLYTFTHFIISLAARDVWEVDSAIKDVNCWTAYTMILFKVVKVCIEPATLIGWADNRRMMQQCTTDSLNNSPQVLQSKSSFSVTCLLTQFALLFINSWK